MISRTRVALALALLGALAAGCVLADQDGLEDEPSLEEAEATTAGLVIRRLDPPAPGTHSVSYDLTSVDPDGGYVEGKLKVCKVVAAGFVDCTVWLCDNHKVDEENNCQYHCGYTCQGTLDECADYGC